MALHVPLAGSACLRGALQTGSLALRAPPPARAHSHTWGAWLCPQRDVFCTEGMDPSRERLGVGSVHG